MSLSKVSAALKILSEDTKGGVLSLDFQIPCRLDDNGGSLFKSVRPKFEHLQGQVAAADALLEPGCCNLPYYNPILFEQLTGDLIILVAFCTHVAAGPSGVDAYAWQRLCFSFSSASVALCNSIAAVACRLKS